MRRAATGVVLTGMAFTIVLLVLNLRERDVYLDGREIPPAGPINVDPNDGALGWLSSTIEHDGCVHRAEFSENHRWMRVRDHDCWYRLFWAADDFYYFEDPSAFNKALQNRDARDPCGHWNIAVTYRPPARCDRKPESLRLRYSLVIDDLGDPSDRTGPVPRRIPWLTSRTPEGIRCFIWKLEERSP